MNAFAWSGLLIGITSTAMGIFVYSRNPKNKINRLWSIFVFAVAIWGIGAFKIGLTEEVLTAILWWRITHVGVIFIPVLFLHFVYVFLDKREKWPIIVSYVSGFFFLITNFTGHLIKNVEWVFNTFYYDGRPPTALYALFTFLWSFSIAYSHLQLLLALRNATGVKKNQIRYFFFATAAGFSGGGTSFLPVFGIDIYPYGNFTVPLYPLIMAYAIVRYRLMDIKVAITRAGIFIALYTLILGIPFIVGSWFRDTFFVLLEANWWYIPLGIMAILATVGPFIYIYIDRKAEERLFKEQKRYQNTLKQASLGMTRIRDLRKLLKLTVYTVSRSVRIDYASIYIADKENTFYTLGAFRGKINKEPPQLIDMNSELAGYLKETGEALVFDEIRRKQQDVFSSRLAEITQQMELLGASVIVPSLIEDNLLGFMILGDKRSGKIYTEDDLRVFTVLANQAALAIENARFFDESREMQDQISQAEKMATIGTMADGLSHQINNRFYALSLIAGDTLDTLKITDTVNWAKEQKDLFLQIQHGLERIMANVAQGGDIVKGVLKYTRKGEEGFTGVPLDKIIDATLDMVQYKIKLSNIDIVRDYAKDIPLILGNLTQLQEVFFNLIDNAYDATMERREVLEEAGYRGKVRIYTENLRQDMLRICIEDNGIGVKQEDFKKLFTPFFTTKTSTRTGTGLGLYVIKKIIASNHNGKLSVESNYKQGTRFKLDLPISTIALKT